MNKLMSDELQPSTSPSSELTEDEAGGELDILPQQMQCLTEFRQWVETEAEFYGRTDDEFLVMFLRGCEFDLKLTKTTLNTYYNCRRTIPHWWSNRDLNDQNIMALARLKRTTALIDKHNHQPTVLITKANRVGDNLNNFDDHGKLMTIVFDTIMRRRNCQMNGAIWIVDCPNCPSWYKRRMLQPSTIRDYATSFYKGGPIRVNKIIFIDASATLFTIYKLIQPFIPQTFKQKVHFCRSVSLNLSDHVPPELLPEEYGGEAGPLADHEEAFLRELIAFNDYLLDDSKYGFQD